MNNKKALFLDRDGVINKDFGYVYKKQDFIFKKDIFNLIKVANNNGYLVIIVTNQSGIGRGMFGEEDFLNLMQWVKNEFKKQNCFIDGLYYCPYHTKAIISKYRKTSDLRKPNPGMIIKAVKDHNLKIENCILIGDRKSDIDAGISAGVKTNLLLKEDSDYPFIKTNTYYIVNSLKSATNYLELNPCN